MRALLPFICVCLIAALASCGDEDGDGNGAKQTKVSAHAYPAIEKFAASDIELDEYGPVCDGLEAAKEDRVAAVAEKTCRNFLKLTKGLEPFDALVNQCKDVDCVADKTEPVLRRYLSSFGETLRGHNSALEGVLEPGPCLTALKIPQADLATLERSRRRVPAAIKRLRGGDTNALDGLFKGGLDAPDPAPCKP